MTEPTRHSICISQSGPSIVRHQGDEGFYEVLRKHYEDNEAAALEQLVQLKARLRTISPEDFWRVFCEGMSRICGSQYVIVSQKEPGTPELGQVGACLTAMCWFWNDGHGQDGFAKGIDYHAYACPCSEMRHGKAFLVPNRLNELFPDNPNTPSLAIPLEAYFAIPLHDSQGEVGHFALMWSAEGVQNLKLRWSFVETLMRTVEDICAKQMREGPSLAKQAKIVEPEEAKQIVPLRILAEMRSLRPYAKNLSHELRTPMQGIVGMLDVMYANVQEAAELDSSDKMRRLIQELKSSIETIQDSSRRAVDAADNVVQAYALNMGIPDDTLSATSIEEVQPADGHLSSPQTISTAQSRPPLRAPRGVKRRSDDDLQTQGHRSKTRHIDDGASHTRRRSDIEAAVHETIEADDEARFSPSMIEVVGNGMQYVNVREMIECIVNESLRSGGRPEKSIVSPTANGQVLDIQTRLSDGTKTQKCVAWTVQSSVPDFILAEERATAKMISCVFHNALKFTDTGRITMDVELCQNARSLRIVVTDTGSGIPETFQARIFKPFAREDESITRQSEGLGLGLLIAKGLSKKMGGDLTLVRSATTGPNKGSTFELRIPLSPSALNSVVPSSPSSVSSKTSIHEVKSAQAHVTQLSNGSNTSSPVSKHSPPSVHNTIEQPLPHLLTQQQPSSPRHDPPEVVSGPLPFHSDTPPFIRPPPPASTPQRPSPTKRNSFHFDRRLAESHPLTFLVAEDNIINRKLLVSMLVKLGYDPDTQIYEAYDGADAVAQVQTANSPRQSPVDGQKVKGPVDVVLMDLWMPRMDGYEATEKILKMFRPSPRRTVTAPGRLSAQSQYTTTPPLDGDIELTDGEDCADGVVKGVAPTILAVTADATDGAAERAKKAGMQGFMVKPFRVRDLEKLVKEGYMKREAIWRGEPAGMPAIAV